MEGVLIIVAFVLLLSIAVSVRQIANRLTAPTPQVERTPPAWLPSEQTQKLIVLGAGVLFVLYFVWAWELLF